MDPTITKQLNEYLDAENTLDNTIENDLFEWNGKSVVNRLLRFIDAQEFGETTLYIDELDDYTREQMRNAFKAHEAVGTMAGVAAEFDSTGGVIGDEFPSAWKTLFDKLLALQNVSNDIQTLLHETSFWIADIRAGRVVVVAKGELALAIADGPLESLQYAMDKSDELLEAIRDIYTKSINECDYTVSAQRLSGLGL